MNTHSLFRLPRDSRVFVRPEIELVPGRGMGDSHTKMTGVFVVPFKD